MEELMFTENSENKIFDYRTLSAEQIENALYENIRCVSTLCAVATSGKPKRSNKRKTVSSLKTCYIRFLIDPCSRCIVQF